MELGRRGTDRSPASSGCKLDVGFQDLLGSLDGGLVEFTKLVELRCLGDHGGHVWVDIQLAVSDKSLHLFGQSGPKVVG